MTISSVASNGLQGVSEPPQMSPAEAIEKFKTKIKYFYNYNNKSTEQVADELFSNIPETVELDQAINYIFEEGRSDSKILCMLQAFAFAYPEYQLSPYDQIRKAIAEDKELTNQSFMALFREHGLNPNQEQMNACYDLAYHFNRPYVYPISQTPVQPHEYSLNFVSVNLNPQGRVRDVAQNIFKNGLDNAENADWLSTTPAPQDEERIKASFMYRLSLWALKNLVEINLWYDSALVTERARDNTLTALKAMSAVRGANLKLRDIRQLPSVRGITENSLHPGVNREYRKNLMEVLVAQHMISSPEGANYCVVSDIEVEPMDAQHLFDQRTVSYLSTNGYVFNRVGFSNFENNFFIFNKENGDLQRIHEERMIRTAEWKINAVRDEPLNASFRDEWLLGAQSIYELYHRGYPSYKTPGFLRDMGEASSFEQTNPRKVVASPKSQFNLGGNFPKSDFKAEMFRFIGDDKIPYTRFGRTYNPYTKGEYQIEKLIGWRAEPLPPFVEMPPLVDVPLVEQESQASSPWKCRHPGYDPF